MSWFEKPVALRTGIKYMTVKDHLAFAFGLLFSLVLLTSLALGQPKNAAPTLLNGEAADWQVYRANNSNVSAIFPKVPVSSESNDMCNELAGESMTAYFDEVVYELSVFRKGDRITSYPCSNPTHFDAKSFARSLVNRRRAGPTIVTEATNGNWSIKQLKWESPGSTRITYVFYDNTNFSWVEATVTFRDRSKVKESEFVSSVKFDKKIGKKIKSGSKTIIGDLLIPGKTEDKDEKVTETSPEPISVKSSPSADPDALVVVKRKIPGYTDLARQNQEKGTVVLKATFQANGMVGKVTVQHGLAYGLTEAAIAAVKQMAFLPAHMNGRAVSIVKTVEFSFSIY